MARKAKEEEKKEKTQGGFEPKETNEATEVRMSPLPTSLIQRRQVILDKLKELKEEYDKFFTALSVMDSTFLLTKDLDPQKVYINEQHQVVPRPTDQNTN